MTNNSLAAKDFEPLSQAALDILYERARQITVEGYCPEYDDRYVNGELAGAASAYALSAAAAIRIGQDAPIQSPPPFFPWEEKHWKPTTPRRDLVKAAALILAELERLDRAADRNKGERNEL